MVGWKPWLVSVVVVMTLGPLARPVHAAEGDKAAARAHFEAATRLYDVHDYAKALEEYKAAYIAKPDPAFLFNMGQCYKKLGRPAEALGFYRDYLKKAAPDDPYRASIEARVQELESGDLFEGSKSPRPAAPLSAPPVSAPTPPPAPYAGPATPPPSTPALTASPTVPAAAQPAGVDLAPAVPPEPASAGTPFYGTWWFWTGVGAAVVAGTVTAVVLAKGGTTTNTSNAPLGTRGVFP